jgi:hypothetical protein
MNKIMEMAPSAVIVELAPQEIFPVILEIDRLINEMRSLVKSESRSTFPRRGRPDCPRSCNPHKDPYGCIAKKHFVKLR